MTVIKSTVLLATVALSVTTAQSSDPLSSIISSINSTVNSVIPGGLASLSALGISIPSSLTSEAGAIAGYLAPIISSPQGSAALSSVLSGHLPSLPFNTSNITLSTFVPPACQAAIYNATAGRSDCGPLYNILYSDSARQNQTAVGQACAPANQGCLTAVEQAVQQNQAVCESYINYGIPGFSNIPVNYLNLILEGACTQASINGTQQYCLPTWDNAAQKIATQGLNKNLTGQLCYEPCRDALAAKLTASNSNVTAPSQVHYAKVLDAACAVDPATGDFCLDELAGKNVLQTPTTGAMFAADAGRFCSPCARIEMALGYGFTKVNKGSYDNVVEQIEGYACASDITTGQLCSEVIYNQFLNASSGLQAFYTNQQLGEQCALSIVLGGSCPAQCKQPVQQFLTGLGSCGGLIVSNQTLGFASLLPAPFGSLLQNAFTTCQLQTETPPAAFGTVVANLITSNVTNNGTLMSMLTGSSNAVNASSVLSVLNYPYATVTEQGTQFNFSGDSALSTGLIAQRLTDAIYQGVFGNGSSVAIVPGTISSGSLPNITVSSLAKKLSSGRWFF